MPRPAPLPASDEEICSSGDETDENNKEDNRNKKSKNGKTDKMATKESDKGNKKGRESRGKKSANDSVTINGEYISAARTIARCINLWCEVDKVIKIAQMLEQEEASNAGELEEDEAVKKLRAERLKKYDDKTRQHFMDTFHKILEVAPGLSPLIRDPKRAAELSIITQKMNETIHGTRSIDATKLRSYIGQYAALDPHKAALDPPIVNMTGQEAMGLKHPILARFICPADRLKEFNEHPEETRKLLESGKISMKANSFPVVFWSGDEYPGDKYDPDNICEGLFKGYMLPRIGRHIFIGPTSALNTASKKGSKSCNAMLHDMTTVEPEHIAYICVQTRFGISSMSSWNEKEGEFSYLELYRYVVSFIRNAIDTEWKDDLLKWWNTQLFGNEKGCGFTEKLNKEGASAASSEPTEMTMLDKMWAQMEARMAAKREAASVSARPRGTHVEAGQAPTPPASSDADQTEATSRGRAAITRQDNTTSPKHLRTPPPCLRSSPRASSRRNSMSSTRRQYQRDDSLTPGAAIPRRWAMRFPSGTLDNELEELTPIPVEKNTKGKAKRHTPDSDEDSTPAISDQELTPIPVKKKGKGKKNAAAGLEDNGEGTRRGHARKSKRQRTVK